MSMTGWSGEIPTRDDPNVAAGEDLKDAHAASEGTSSSSEGSDSEQVGQFYRVSPSFLLKINTFVLIVSPEALYDYYHGKILWM